VNAFVKSFLAVMVIATAGCATLNTIAPLVVLPADGRAASSPGNVFPARYRAVQRAIVTTGGKQFTCDGLLTVSPEGGHHLALVSSFGVVTDLRIKPDGDLELLKITPLFPEDWSRNIVARDLRCLFVSPPKLQSAGRLADGRLVLESAASGDGTVARYVLAPDGAGWQELELTRRGKAFYRATVKHHRSFVPGAAEVPDAFDVVAESYRLEVRVVALTAEATP